MTQNKTTYLFLLGLTLVAAYGCYLLVAQFLKPILFASVAAVLCYPLYSKIQHAVKNRNVASVLTTLIVVFLIAVSSALLGGALATGLHEIYDSLNASGDGRERLGVYLMSLLEKAEEFAARYIPVSVTEMHTTVTGQTQKMVASMVNSLAGFLRGITSGVVNALICAFILFFLLRDGRGLVRKAYVLLPLRVDYTKRLFIRTQETLRAIVYGTLVIAALQGTLTGLGFWLLGVTSPVLWAVVASLCALVPVIGTGFVLVPAISMLLFSGHWAKALILLAWGFAIVHPIDNVLRPYLIGERTKLSALFVFFALLGGLRAFGAPGLFLGPVILSGAIALFGFLREESRRGALDFEPLREGSSVRESSSRS
jgi:predicted PurR-regulated permease PerM